MGSEHPFPHKNLNFQWNIYRRQERRRSKEWRPMQRGAETKSGGRWGAAPKQRAAADATRKQERRRNKERRPMGRGDRSGAKTKSGGRCNAETGAAPKQRAAADCALRQERHRNKEWRPMQRPNKERRPALRQERRLMRRDVESGASITSGG